jgi:hypothetical protein
MTQEFYRPEPPQSYRLDPSANNLDSFLCRLKRATASHNNQFAGTPGGLDGRSMSLPVNRSVVSVWWKCLAISSCSSQPTTAAITSNVTVLDIQTSRIRIGPKGRLEKEQGCDVSLRWVGHKV